MQQHWITHAGNRNLIIYVLGWGAEPGVVAHIVPEGYDTLAIYDFRSVEALSPDRFTGYHKIYLFAWSFGVWAAEQIMDGIPMARAIACGGTPLPVDDSYGIPRRPFAITMRNIRNAGTDTFLRRAYGNFYPIVAAIPPSRNLSELTDELEHLYEESAKPYTPHIKWDRALVGSLDAIFPPENMAAYWGKTGTVVEGMPHYPFADPVTVTSELI